MNLVPAISLLPALKLTVIGWPMLSDRSIMPMSRLAPPTSLLTPPPPFSRSWPPLPVRVSLPPVPTSTSLAEPPVRTSRSMPP